ncbi:hypothetical protein BASA83_009489 [Batrachochytrium salamandrivorans]|nr:hypothetical protein BASA83_009489 [Batrachochytrium salamandrivorans]
MRLSILAVLINASLVLGQQYYVNTGPNSLDVNSPTYQKHKRAAGPSFATTHSHELASPTVNLSASQSPSTTTVVPPKQNSSSYPKWNKIAVDRAAGRFTFVPFTRAQKETVLKNVETIFKVWVNYETKIKHYGPSADPFPKLRHIRETIETSSDSEFQLSLTDIFNIIHDRHTRFFSAPPYSCFYASTGITYQFVDGPGNIVTDPTVVVSKLSNNKEFRELVGSAYDAISIGDKLESIDGLSFYNWYTKNRALLSGANEFGGQRSALRYLTLIQGKINRLPDADSLHQLYQNLTGITLPGTPDLPTPEVASVDVSTPTTSQQHPASSTDTSTLAQSQQEDQKKDLLTGENSDQPFKFKDGDVTSLSWAIWKPKSKNLGIIQIKDFQPGFRNSHLDATQAMVQEIRTLLVTELKYTKAVILDIRGNMGGAVVIAEKIPQLFKSDFAPNSQRYLFNDLAYRILVNSSFSLSDAVESWNLTPPGSRYTTPVAIDSKNLVNTMGQAYLKPMGVFMDGECYSSCDILAGSIQSTQAGTIFGEDGQTGAGGAEIMELDPLLINHNPIDFHPMPFSAELSHYDTGETYNNVLSVAVRQAVRSGIYAGQLLEDTGAIADMIVRARVEDLLPNPNHNSQYDRIADALDSIGRGTGQNELYFVAEPFDLEITGTFLNIQAELAGISEIFVLNGDGATVANVMNVPKDTKYFNITADIEVSRIGNRNIVIIGNAFGKQVLKTYRSLRVNPKSADYIPIGPTTSWTLQGPTPSVGVYNYGSTSEENGWHILNGSWTIGNGKSYALHVNSTLEAFFTAPIGTNITISLDMDIDIESNFDLLYLNVRNSANSQDPLITSDPKMAQ